MYKEAVYVQGGRMCTRRQYVYMEAVCVHGGSILICTRKQYMYREAECVHGGSMCTWKQYVYMEAVYVQGGRIRTWRQYMYMEAVYVHGGNIWRQYMYMEAVCSTDLLPPTYQTAPCHNSEGHYMNANHCKKLR